jgi:hypothetical protein
MVWRAAPGPYRKLVIDKDILWGSLLGLLYETVTNFLTAL